jgi:hypothetical protein
MDVHYLMDDVDGITDFIMADIVANTHRVSWGEKLGDQLVLTISLLACHYD